MTDLLQREYQVIKKPNRLFCTFTLWGGERLGQPVLSPLKNVPTFLFIFQTFSLCYSFTVPEELRMNDSNERVKFSNLQTNKVIDTSTLWGGERLGQPVLSPLKNVLTFLFIFQSFGFSYSFTESKHL